MMEISATKETKEYFYLLQCNLSLLIFYIFASHLDKPNGEATYQTQRIRPDILD